MYPFLMMCDVVPIFIRWLNYWKNIIVCIFIQCRCHARWQPWSRLRKLFFHFLVKQFWRKQRRHWQFHIHLCCINVNYAHLFMDMKFLYLNGKIVIELCLTKISSRVLHILTRSKNLKNTSWHSLKNSFMIW